MSLVLMGVVNANFMAEYIIFKNKMYALTGVQSLYTERLWV